MKIINLNFQKIPILVAVMKNPQEKNIKKRDANCGSNLNKLRLFLFGEKMINFASP